MNEQNKHMVSSDNQQYQEEIKSLKTHIKSLEFQIADLKTYIVNQRNMHARQMQTVKNGEKDLQEKLAKAHKQLVEYKSHPVIIRKSLKETKDSQQNITAGMVREIVQQVCMVMENNMSNIVFNLNERLNILNSRMRKTQLLISNLKFKVSTQKDTNRLAILNLKSNLQQKVSLTERQNKLIQQMIVDKKQSDSLYERHLGLLEGARDQKKHLMDRLERAGSDFNQYNSLRDSMRIRRIIEGSISFSKEMEGSKHQDLQPTVAMHSTLPHFTSFPIRTSNHTILDDGYHKTTTDSTPFTTTERETPNSRNHKQKIKDCFRRAMSNLASPDKYINVNGKCLQSKSPIQPQNANSIKQKTVQQPVTGKRKITKKVVDITSGKHIKHIKENIAFC